MTAENLADKVWNELISVLHVHSVNAKNWHLTNCMMCGETKHRGNFICENREIGYNCFKCNYKTRWSEGRPMPEKFTKLLEGFGVDRMRLHRLRMAAVQGGGELKSFTPAPAVDMKTPQFKTVALPVGAMALTKAVSEGREFDDHLEYLLERGFTHPEDYADIYVSRDMFTRMDRRVIIPFRGRNREIIGWSARLIEEIESVPKYWSCADASEGAMFGADQLEKSWPPLLFVTEGVLDAKFIGGVAVGGNDVRSSQIGALVSCPRTKVVVPDNDLPGNHLVKAAKQHNWMLSFIDKDWMVKDVAEACAGHGRFRVVESLVRNMKTARAAEIRQKLTKREIGIKKRDGNIDPP